MVCELGGIHDDFSVKDELQGSCFLSFFFVYDAQFLNFIQQAHKDLSAFLV